jgi:hypothetical protein
MRSCVGRQFATNGSRLADQGRVILCPVKTRPALTVANRPVVREWERSISTVKPT